MGNCKWKVARDETSTPVVYNHVTDRDSLNATAIDHHHSGDRTRSVHRADRSLFTKAIVSQLCHVPEPGEVCSINRGITDAIGELTRDRRAAGSEEK